MSRLRTGGLLTALTIAAATALTACGGSGDDSANTLTLWHYEGANSAMGIAWNEAIKVFEKEHPDVTVKFEEKSFEQTRQTGGMVLNSDDGPDILEYPKGNATAGLLAKQGLLTDLSDEVKERGWDKQLSSSLATTAQYDARGVMGSGQWYGIPNYGEYVMVYYNKALFEQQGLQLPTSLAELESTMDAFTKAGITPLSVGGAEYPAQQVFYQLALSKADRAFVDDYQLYTNPVDFTGPEFTYGAETFADWVSKGYISKDSASLKAEDMGVSFISGKAPMIISGSWWYGRFQDEIKDFEWGSFLFPGNTFNAGSSGNIWVVPESSDNKDLAYDFIDITMRPEIQNLLGNSGGVPVSADPAEITDPKNKELIENFNTIADNDGLAFYPDWPAPGYYDVLVSGFQELINQTKSPADVLAEIKGPYDEYVAELGD